MRLIMVLLLLFGLALAGIAQQITISEAPTGFDDMSNGVVDDATHQADQEAFDEFETAADGLGPLYNAQSCRECHQAPTSGGASQITELRVGHPASDGGFRNPSIPIGHGADIISNRSLVNDRATCPSKKYPDMEIQQRVPDTETIRATRLSLNLLGDGFVEAVADQTLINIAAQQCKSTFGRICGQVVRVPIVEAPGTTGVGRFGWKDQHASLQSFSSDAYLNEMGITTRLFPDNVTELCSDATTGPEDSPGPDGLDDADHFTRFIRATKAPARDAVLAASAPAIRGSDVFKQVGCSTCHVPTLTTAPAGTKINGGTFTIPAALGSKQFHPYGDFLMHNVGTGDGIATVVQEHFGKKVQAAFGAALPPAAFGSLQYKMRTAPLWGVRQRSRLMHDGVSLTFSDAILRHGGEASDVRRRYFQLPAGDRDALLAFLASL